MVIGVGVRARGGLDQPWGFVLAHQVVLFEYLAVRHRELQQQALFALVVVVLVVVVAAAVVAVVVAAVVVVVAVPKVVPKVVSKVVPKVVSKVVPVAMAVNWRLALNKTPVFATAPPLAAMAIVVTAAVYSNGVFAFVAH